MESAITAYISNKKILFHIFYFDDLLFEVQYKAMLSIYYMPERILCTIFHYTMMGTFGLSLFCFLYFKGLSKSKLSLE